MFLVADVPASANAVMARFHSIRFSLTTAANSSLAFISGHNNKVAAAWTDWYAEAGNAQADILRLQWQLNF